MTKESFDFVLVEPTKGIYRLVLASTEETKRIDIPELYERDGDDVRKALLSLIRKLNDLLEWVNKVDPPKKSKRRNDMKTLIRNPESIEFEIRKAENGFYMRVVINDCPFFHEKERVAQTDGDVRAFLNEMIDLFCGSKKSEVKED